MSRAFPWKNRRLTIPPPSLAQHTYTTHTSIPISPGRTPVPKIDILASVWALCRKRMSLDNPAAHGGWRENSPRSPDSSPRKDVLARTLGSVDGVWVLSWGATDGPNPILETLVSLPALLRSRFRASERRLSRSQVAPLGLRRGRSGPMVQQLNRNAHGPLVAHLSRIPGGRGKSTRKSVCLTICAGRPTFDCSGICNSHSWRCVLGRRARRALSCSWRHTSAPCQRRLAE